MESIQQNKQLRIGIIYKYTNKINGKSYIGQTINPKSRKQDHLNRLKRNTGIDTAIAKYGADMFTYEVIYTSQLLPINELKQLLNEKEIEYISLYDTYKHGYNQTLGGGGTAGFPCPEKSKEFRKWYNEHRNELLTEETRNKLRENAYKTYDKRYTEDACKKMSDANRYIRKNEDSVNKMKESMKNVKTRNGVKIDFYDNDELICSFNSRKECIEYFDGKLKIGVIKNMLAGKYSCRKYPTYKLKYADEKEHTNLLCGTKNMKKVVQLTLDNEYVKTWNSLNECIKCGYKPSLIGRCCRHEPHRFSYKGYKWLFEEEYNLINANN